MCSLSPSTECDCNGYDSSCDDKSGECTCYDVGVAGPHCAVCNTNSSYEGDADNICYCEFGGSVSRPFCLVNSVESLSPTYKVALRN